MSGVLLDSNHHRRRASQVLPASVAEPEFLHLTHAIVARVVESTGHFNQHIETLGSYVAIPTASFAGFPLVFAFSLQSFRSTIPPTMKVENVRWFYIPLMAYPLAIVFRLPGTSNGTIGVSAQWANGDYHFVGGSDPKALLFAPLAIGFYFLLMYAEPAEVRKPFPGIVRRYFAFWFDFIFLAAALNPVFGLLPILVEWRNTRVFQWTVERDVYAHGDLLQGVAGTLLFFGFLLFYFAWPLTRHRDTPGAYLRNYQVVADDGNTLSFGRAALRSFVGLVSASWFPLAFFWRDKKAGKYWVDKIFKTHAESLHF